MTLSIPDFETLAVTRLKANNLEIQALGGLKRVYSLSPITAPEMGEFPFAAVRVGAMRNQIPNTSAGQLIVTRDFIIELPVAPLTNTNDTGNQGTDALTAALPWFAIVRDYYMQRPRLNTDALPSLQYLSQDVFLQDGGMVQMGVPGGATYVGVLYTLTLSFRGKTTRTS